VNDPNRPVEEDKLDVLIEAARWAPSCGNRQSWTCLVCRSESLDGVKACLNPGNSCAKRARVILAAASNAEQGCRITGRDYSPLDSGLSIEKLLLQCVAMGLVGHPIEGFIEARLMAELGIPDGYRVYALVVIGYPGSTEDWTTPRSQGARFPQAQADRIDRIPGRAGKRKKLRIPGRPKRGATGVEVSHFVKTIHSCRPTQINDFG
jgi:nitroreductase